MLLKTITQCRCIDAKGLLAVLLATFALMTSGSSEAQQAVPQSARYSTYGTGAVSIRVHWSTQQEVEQRCGKQAAGCASPATAEKSYAEIWAQKPAGWEDDDAICYLGSIVLRIFDNNATVRTNTAEAQLTNSTPQLQTVLR